MREKIVPIEVTPEMMKMLEICKKNKSINPELYTQYDVKRGLRDINGKGVLAGLTEIGEIHAYDTLSDGSSKPCDGKLYYHGYDVEDLIKGFIRDKRFGFEEVTYLLLFGELPNKNELDIFTKTLSHMRTIPPSFVRDIIMQAPSKDMMNALSRGVLTLYAYDDKADDVSLPNVLRQCLQLIAQFPLLSVYGYQAFKYYHENDSFIVHAPKPELSTAENILHMLRNDSQYTELEARILDIALILHAEHGGGNNSTFTTHVVTSSGTDTYSTVAASLGALKGPKHGGANIKVTQMFEDMKKNIKNWNDDKEIVDTFVLKTIKRFEEKNGANQELLPEFKDDEDQEFARRLFRRTILNADYYRHLVSENTKNWDLDRIAFMDIIIMQTALAEILSFPNIQVSVSLNEYVEIAKLYSTAKSGSFINGTLDGIVNQLKKEGKLTKN